MENSTTPDVTVTVAAKKSPRMWPRHRSDYREFEAKTRVYFWPEGETIWDNLMNRRARPYHVYREQLVEVFRQIDWLEDTPLPKARWSQKAGCSCGCSPGFILDRRLTDDDHRPFDISVAIS